MDLAESISPDRSLEIVEATKEIAHPYDEIINENCSSEKDCAGSLANYINDEAAEFTHSSSSWQLTSRDLSRSSLDIKCNSPGELVDTEDLNKQDEMQHKIETDEI